MPSDRSRAVNPPRARGQNGRRRPRSPPCWRGGRTCPPRSWIPFWVSVDSSAARDLEPDFSRMCERVRRKAMAKGVRPRTFHCTRHTFVAWALEAGTPVTRIAEWVGASVKVIEDTYRHVLPQDDADLSFTTVDRTKSAESGRHRTRKQMVSRARFERTRKLRFLAPPPQLRRSTREILESETNSNGYIDF